MYKTYEVMNGYYPRQTCIHLFSVWFSVWYVQHPEQRTLNFKDKQQRSQQNSKLIQLQNLHEIYNTIATHIISWIHHRLFKLIFLTQEGFSHAID